jgi:hypothetical protein
MSWPGTGRGSVDMVVVVAVTAAVVVVVVGLGDGSGRVQSNVMVSLLVVRWLFDTLGNHQIPQPEPYSISLHVAFNGGATWLRNARESKFEHKLKLRVPGTHTLSTKCNQSSILW